MRLARARRATRPAPKPAAPDEPITIGTAVWVEKDGPGDWQPGFVGGYAWAPGVQKAEYFEVRFAHAEPTAQWVTRKYAAVRRRSVPMLAERERAGRAIVGRFEAYKRGRASAAADVRIAAGLAAIFGVAMLLALLS